MRRQIRCGIFETNSSSVHSLTMCSKEEYTKWENGELYKARYDDLFLTRDEIIEELKNETHWASKELIYKDVDWNDKEKVDKIIKNNEYVTEKEFWDDIEYETFYESHTTPGGETVIAFGYYGEDR